MHLFPLISLAKSTLLFCLFVLFTFSLEGQKTERDSIAAIMEDLVATDISISGILSDYHSKKPITTGKVTITSDNNDSRMIPVDSMAGWIDLIPCDHLYKIEFSAPGYVSKHVIIDARSIPIEEQLGGFDMDIDITLFKRIEGLDYSILDTPVGVSRYDPFVYAIAWDPIPVRRTQDELKRLMRSYDKLYKEKGLDKK